MKQVFHTLITVLLILSIQACTKTEEIAKEEAVAKVELRALEIDITELELNEGETRLLSVRLIPEETTDKTIVWTSEKQEIANVSAKGEVEALTVGETTITATSTNNIKISCKVIVKAQIIHISQLEIDPANLTLKQGESSQLKAIISPANATDNELKWESSDTNIVSITQTGQVEAKTEGEVTITLKTANYSCIRAFCKIKVERTAVKGMADKLINSSLILGLNDNAITLPESSQSDMEKKISIYFKEAKASLPFAANIYLVCNYFDYISGDNYGNGLLIYSEMESDNIFIPLQFTKISEDEVKIKFEAGAKHNLNAETLDKILNNKYINKIKSYLEDSKGIRVNYNKISEDVELVKLSSNTDEEMFWNFFNEKW